jgi:hypothetical protein
VSIRIDPESSSRWVLGAGDNVDETRIAVAASSSNTGVIHTVFIWREAP